MRFGYYFRLDSKAQATYRKSDGTRSVAIPDAARLGPLVVALDETLASGQRAGTWKATDALVVALLLQLGVPPVRVVVRAVRPAIEGGELHGLYTFGEEGKPPVIEVWMRTAAHERVVRFRTFLRTLLHEVMHHLDVTFLGLDDSFHTEGFFKRESSLVRQLLPKLRETSRAPRMQAPEQLPLFASSEDLPAQRRRRETA